MNDPRHELRKQEAASIERDKEEVRRFCESRGIPYDPEPEAVPVETQRRLF